MSEDPRPLATPETTTARAPDEGRRAFLRHTTALLAAALGGCKIEAIGQLPPSREQPPRAFPDLPPKIPDALADAEDSLRALTEELLSQQIPLFTQGALREREIGDGLAVYQLEELLAEQGFVPAGPGGGWRQPVAFVVIEPTGGEAKVVLRSEAAPAAVEVPDAAELGADLEDERGETETEAEADAETKAERPKRSSKPALSPSAGAGEDTAGVIAVPEGAPTPASPPGPIASLDPAAAPATAPPPDPLAPPTLDPAAGDPGAGLPPPAETPFAAELTALGAFRQIGTPSVVAGLLASPILDYATRLPRQIVAGRVLWMRAPEGFDALAADAPERLEAAFAAARDAGAVGCVLLSDDPGPGVLRFREQWAEQRLRADDLSTDDMLLVGLLGAEGSTLVETAMLPGEVRVVDVDLAQRQRNLEGHNLMARLVGRERPSEVVILTCAWDTPSALTQERDTLRLLATLGAAAQLASWQRRSTRSYRSLMILLTADGGIGAGQLEHARWSASQGMRPTVVLALDRPTQGGPSPALLVTGHFDETVATIDQAVVDREKRELLFTDELSMPTLAPYLRWQHPVMTVGEPPDELLADLALEPPTQAEPDQGQADQGQADQGQADQGEASGQPQANDQPGGFDLDDLHVDIQLLRNLMLALGARG
ncbi:hypothetical protein G6O69_20565 [Pseudenhygromyxa sp. WMMC2535]|uniref:hypothetical protein n=1 Tax=Pseudenhygromyxa sp. WMMC2535 TaxID=2712867 RepID=UPI00155449E8|nr:hypothetical protein [Pseudenhygromyxa sp. WMMC2535]NVB40248.1 hypothetical protein [Pseudenhygromyxa sp. WMMC2535]